MNDDTMVTGTKKSEYARNIELFDVSNLTPENIEYMMQVVREYFKAHFPVKPELIDDILQHMRIVDNEEFKHALAESGNDVEDVHLKYGFYDKRHNIGFIDKRNHQTSGEIFVTIFHESLHAVSIGAGAGFKGDFALSFESGDIERRVAMERGLITLTEGTTHYLTLKSVIGDMGFDGTENMLRYKAERSIMSQIWEAFPENALYKAYFETPIEEIRRYFDTTFGTDGDDPSSGKFIDFLVNIGVAADRIKKLLESGEENEGEAMAIHDDIMRAVDYFLAYEQRAKN